MRDEIRLLSEQLASDPSSQVFARLADLLRRDGQLDLARDVVERGLHRHPYYAYAHQVLARICLDMGLLERARDEWDMARRLAPDDADAAKGIAFVEYRMGNLGAAEKLLRDAARLAPHDSEIAAALSRLRVGSPAPGAVASARGQHPAAFGAANGTAQAEWASASANGAAPAERESVSTNGAKSAHDAAPAVLAVDSQGMVIDGTWVAGGEERTADIAAHLAGVCAEAVRLLEHLELGEWRAAHVEAKGGSLALAPVGADAIVQLGVPGQVPPGRVRQMLERERRRLSERMTGK